MKYIYIYIYIYIDSGHCKLSKVTTRANHHKKKIQRWVGQKHLHAHENPSWNLQLVCNLIHGNIFHQK
jgi:hypothetical protein